MGGCVSFQISCDQVLNHAGSYLCGEGNYIQSLEKNLVALEKAMEDLKAKRDDLLQKVQIAEEGGLQRLNQIQVWFTRVETLESRFNDLYNTRNVELERLCFCGLCSQNLKLSFWYGRRVFYMLKEVEDLKSNGVFEVVAHQTTKLVVEERPLQPTIFGQETMLERAWKHLMDDGTEIMGMYGMGGVGKTTLIAQINNKLRSTSYGFDVVIWVVVSKNLQVEKIQDVIAEKLRLNGGEWSQKDESQKAIHIHTFMRKKRFVLLLDDIWRKVDLKKIGVPFPTRENKCKVIFTTRSREVCGHMEVDDPMEVQCLMENDAWDLFQKKVGQRTLKSHAEILEKARKVARKCRGLPLALNVIGEAMACKKTLQEWDHAIDVLTSYAVEFAGMEDEILPVLKYSYDNLKGEQIKSCFRYCALFPEDYQIDKDKLIDYWICEGIIDGNRGRERAVNLGYMIIRKLVNACLLMEDEQNKTYVIMHDVVREMAMWISSDLGCVIKAGVGLRDVPHVEDWSSVKKMSLMRNNIEKISSSSISNECGKLTTLFLQENEPLRHISNEFFLCTPMLVVLDMSWHRQLKELPEQISELVFLRYLDISRTNVKQLPAGFIKLRNLIHLNLEGTWNVESITGISNLSSLRVLKLKSSGVWLDVSLLEELKCLEHLQVFTGCIKSSLAAEKMLYAPTVVNAIQEIDFKDMKEESFRILTLPTMVNLRKLVLYSCKMLEINMERTTSCNKNQTSPCFPNLTYVFIRQCDGLKDLTWLLFAPNLTTLEVWYSHQLEEIISKEKALIMVTNEADITIPFQKLERLYLMALRGLKSIYWNPLPFLFLKEVDVTKCRNLKNPPSRTGTPGIDFAFD